MENLNEMSIEQLKELKEKISALLKEKRAEIKEQEKREKEKIESEMRNSLSVGDVVSFKYKDTVLQGEVISLTDKAVRLFTTQENLGKIYRHYYQIVSIDKKADVEKSA